MHSQLMEYFTSHKLLSNQQYGFRPNRSKELATPELGGGIYVVYILYIILSVYINVAVGF